MPPPCDAYCASHESWCDRRRITRYDSTELRANDGQCCAYSNSDAKFCGYEVSSDQTQCIFFVGTSCTAIPPPTDTALARYELLAGEDRRRRLQLGGWQQYGSDITIDPYETHLKFSVDTDSDGIPDSTDPDSDGDSIPDAEEGSVDTDSDGIPDATDPDSDGDSIPDAEEGTLEYLPASTKWRGNGQIAGMGWCGMCQQTSKCWGGDDGCDPYGTTDIENDPLCAVSYVRSTCQGLGFTYGQTDIDGACRRNWNIDPCFGGTQRGRRASSKSARVGEIYSSFVNSRGEKIKFAIPPPAGVLKALNLSRV